MPPLYKITEGNGKSYKYLKDDAALEAYRDANKGKNYTVNRLKGLGEMSEDETKETLLDKNTRIIKQITMSDDPTNTAELFENLMGTSATFRKQFLKEYAKESMYNVE